jgi:hypothetical protein
MYARTIIRYHAHMMRRRTRQRKRRDQLGVFIRDIAIAATGIWFFEFHMDYRFPESENLLLYFVAVPIIWSTLIHIWTATSYREQRTLVMVIFTHAIAVLLLISTVFLISATLNTIADALGPTGSFLFHSVGWTVVLSLIYYDTVDVRR